MKNIKRLVLLALLVGSVEVLMSSCNTKTIQQSSTSQTSNDTQGLNSSQQAMYNTMIQYLAEDLVEVGMSADKIKEDIKELNEELAKRGHGFKVVDKQKGKPLAKGTSEEDLKKRFEPRKL